MNHVLTAAFVKIAVVKIAVVSGISPYADRRVDARPACAAGGSAIVVEALGLKDRKGRITLELYPANDDDFLRDGRALVKRGKVFARVSAATPQRGAVSLCIRVSQPGAYAILFLHERDGKDGFSISEDGVGLPMNVRIGRRRPKVQEAIVQVGRGVTTVSVQVQYRRGLSGFGTVAR